MIEPPPDTTWLRQTSAQRGAVARVGAVARTERSRPVDPARGTDPRWSDWPRPDPARIAIGDITQFQGLVYGLAGRPLPQGLARAEALTAAADPYPQPHAPPADRITATLQHLRGLRGL
jgi:hypothetical protein